MTNYILLNDIVQPARILKLDTEFQSVEKEWQNGRMSVKRKWRDPVHHLEVEFDGITLAEYNALRAHFVAMSGKYGVFQIRDTHEDVTYTVRFDDDKLSRIPSKSNVRGFYTFKVKFREAR